MKVINCLPAKFPRYGHYIEGTGSVLQTSSTDVSGYIGLCANKPCEFKVCKFTRYNISHVFVCYSGLTK